MAYLGVPRGAAVDAYVNGVRTPVEQVKTVGGRMTRLVARAEASGFAGYLVLLACLTAGVGALFILVTVGVDRLSLLRKSNPQG
jgi:hypothetical protein